jgi:cell division septation protein DedD
VSRPRGQGPSRVGSFFVGLGFLTILTVTFLTGLFVGRQWPRLLPSIGAAGVAAEAPGRGVAEAPARGEPARRRAGERAARETAPLTFYQELTAPLEPGGGPRRRPLRASPPAPGATTGPLPAPSESASATDARREPAVEPAAPAPSAAPAAEGAGRYTVQVAAFKVREPAAALSARLAAAGWEAYLSEAAGSEGARYRVRVGAFATREAAHAAAERLAAAERVSPYVTLR